MAMKKQIKLYSINLGVVKTKREKQLYKMKYTNDNSMFKIKTKLSNKIKNDLGVTEWNKECAERFKEELKEDTFFKVINETNKKLTKTIHKSINNFKDIRKTDSKYFKEVNIIAFFDNSLIRTLNLECENETPTLEFIVIEVGNTDMMIVQQVITNGLIISDRIITEDNIKVVNSKYRFFTAGAGQTRQKKFMMIREKTWVEYEKPLMCGLSIDRINSMGGMNSNKFNAYLSLNNSASSVIENFDIDRCIVVDDFTEIITDEVDYISRDDEVDNGETKYTTKTGKEIIRKKIKTEWDIERCKKDVPIDFMDGAGICLPSVFKKNTQLRLPWFKGIVCPVNYKKYIEATENTHTTIKDIYGQAYDIIKDDIRVIFTKSQFKLWKYYKNIYETDSEGNILKDENGEDKIFMTGWDLYKTCYKYYKCTCNKCMEDEDKLKNMRINYQMLQTLTEMSDNEIEILTKDTRDLIDKVHSNRNEQLEFLGATLEYKKRDYMQEIIRLYPEILTSNYIKKQLSDSITSFKKEAKSGRIKLKAKRTFVIPDLVHFMSLLFGDGKDFALDKNEVCFKTYKNSKRLALLRSPHLSREWGIRDNVENEKTKYFNTNGIYVSCKDLLSLILMNDWDGDETLVIEDCENQKWMIDLAIKQMSNLRPIYYEMGGGEAKEINSTNTYNSLKFVYEKSNIGKVSNTLTNIWSKDDCEKNMDNIKKLCAYNNWIIDSAKKLELPKLPKDIKKIMNNKLYPYFFQFAKDKKKNECREIGNQVMDRISKSIDNVKYTNFDYSKGFGKFDLNKLLHNKSTKIDNKIIEYYLKLEESNRLLIKQYAKKYKDEDCNFNYKELAYTDARTNLLNYSKNTEYKYEDIVDMIIKYSFEQDEMKLAFVFNVFGALIINNLNNNLKNQSIDNGWRLCENCGERFKLKSPNSKQKYCSDCAKEINKKKTLENYYKNK
ncbi:hypothetical protein DVV91_17255 [Clostridium botulinum]|uniref:hypothetical protein n=1 Tax=Clostridium botulinum TaxID=1491 RepID=UPI0019679622|nr:hypothetical protein [Clostridium botulinum]MBN1076070.1 hypothetical protein [Clostridium botulinum]